ncbi:hypothetical protein P0W64_21815 [Tsukamurella sp. 8F]|uniref:hypothetical protein n=1 Tax=unclassified Tsukamurella TaxID=2633480 RepID=UPI0023B8A37B|nr:MULTISPECIES: hypothetical protein [unclassified Tsukamurella]MDF0532316.1 hypothetical protein [Tsukamurella sp. 8J]MDF0589424.1 hypothetical protein [Tsukamurella sp. 8F]
MHSTATLARRLTAVSLLTLAVSAGAAVTAGAADASPAVGSPCIGAEIGKRAVTPGGTRIVCDDYRWVLDHGQVTRHPWADDQR